jgi:hypothetical protein
MTLKTHTKLGACALLAVGLMLPSAALAQRDGGVIAPGPITPVPGPVDPVPIPPAERPSPYAGGYRLSINDTRGAREDLTYAVGWMRVARDGSFVLWARNPEAGGSATARGEVLRNGKLVFTPPLPNNVRAAIKVRRQGGSVTGLFGRYLIVTPAGDGGDDGGDDPVLEEAPALAVVHDRRKKKAGVVIGFRR